DFGDINDQLPYSVSSDNAGNFFLAGIFSGSFDFKNGLTPLGEFGSVYALFVAKLDSNQTPVWAEGPSIPKLSDQDFNSVATDASGDAVVVGDFAGTLDLDDGHPLTSITGSHDLLLAKYDPSGKLLWAKQFGDYSYQSADQVAVDAAGNIVMAS